ncbi:hypothetical protein GPECTOR_13g835 [Gonium pectorale]|uniref:Zinc finger PHD-type domain-containing protein n=1 Tax=Gonium pectorale TaxID=33097 RepID=A0A150GNF3_GONPE|nr:hypothetical protein GPECTOR_13g835 [Gonium pectorale]|eukprot:KXZ51347.1 hypothetical protein GPECTOR_13g835 [Gonium pectorale]
MYGRVRPCTGGDGGGGGGGELDVEAAEAAIADLVRGGRGGGGGGGLGEASGEGEADERAAMRALSSVECGFCRRRLGRRAASGRGPPLLLCDGCHRPFHADCCRFRAVPTRPRPGGDGGWYHCEDCEKCAAQWRQRAAAGAAPAGNGRTWALLTPAAGLPAGGGRGALRRPEATEGLREVRMAAASTAPRAVDAVLDSDYAVLLRDARGAAVAAATLDVYGRDVTVTDLLATRDGDHGPAHVRTPNLESDYCDDFQCTSSPAVEQTVRSLARELTRGRYATTSLYQQTVTYSDGFRTFTGPEGYARQRWIADNVDKYKASITRMRMLDKGTSVVEWRLVGKLGGMDLDVDFTTTCEHNLLTGRINVHRESWNLSRCSPPAAALATLNRYSWSARQALTDVKDGLGKAAQKLGGGGGAGGGMGDMPGDPTRFYQQQGDSGPNQDLFAGGFLIALLYLAFKLFGALETLG